MTGDRERAHEPEHAEEVRRRRDPLLVAEFADVTAVKRAARQVRDGGYSMWDVHSPFPIHGIEECMGIRRTILPLIVLGCGALGLVLGLLLAWYTNAEDYPFIVSGKPSFSLPANIPIIFETTVLLASLGAVFGMFLLNRLPMLYNPLFKSARFRRVTTDGFFVVIDPRDPRYDPQATRELLSRTGATSIEEIEL